jgi:hypothetical protein
MLSLIKQNYILSFHLVKLARWRPSYTRANHAQVRRGKALPALRGLLAISGEDQEGWGTVTQRHLGVGVALDVAISGGAEEENPHHGVVVGGRRLGLN